MSERLSETDNAPVGGFGWDGRFNKLHDQATFPLFNPDEMANKDPAAVFAKLEHTSYASRFKEVFGQNIFVDRSKAFTQAMYAIERFELEDPSFHPYTSKFDYYLEGKVQLTAQELRGKKLFDNPSGDNCASCHIDQSGVVGSHPLFTDFNFQALRVPRNPELRVNADPKYFDMGLCGPLRTDQWSDRTNCSLEKHSDVSCVLSQRPLLHAEGCAALLRTAHQSGEVVSERYAKGKVDKFNDLPVALRVNVDTTDEPLTRKAGERPVWSEKDIDDVAAFLTTLNDDYDLKAKQSK